MSERPRGRERRRKRKRSEESEEEGISGWKLGLVIGVIVVCFAMLYPTVFHPMIMGFFGAKDVQKSNANKPPIHPGMGPGGPRTGGPRHDHPAMRMAAAQHDSQQSTGGGRGMFTWMLPIYTVGVVIFLLYTLFKSKKKKKRSSYGSDSEESDSCDESGGQFAGKLGKKKLRGLQERLQQTEEAMTKILEQLEAVQGLDLTSIEQTLEQPTPKKELKKKEPIAVKPALSSQSEQYIGDLERALKEFKVLSEAYEKEKDRHLAKDNDSMTSDSELNSSASSADSEEEERVRQKERSRRRREKEKKTKGNKSKDDSEDLEDESHMPELEEQDSEEEIPSPAAQPEPAERDEEEEVVAAELQEALVPDVAEKASVVDDTPVPKYSHVAEESKIESKPVDKKVRRRARRT